MTAVEHLLWNKGIGSYLYGAGIRVQSLAQLSGFENPVLLQLQRRSQRRLGSDPWPGNSLCCGAANKEKKRTDAGWLQLLIRS